MHAYIPAIHVLIDSSSIMTKEGKTILWQVDTNCLYVRLECEGCIPTHLSIYNLYMSSVIISQ